MYAPILRQLPDDLRMTMLELVEAVEQNMRVELAVRREDFEQLQTTMAELAEAQQRTEQRVNELAEAQQRTEQRLAELAEAQQRTEQVVRELVVLGKDHTDKIAQLIGDNLERRMRERAYGYFGGLMRRPRAVDLVELDDQLLERLPPDEYDDVRLIDLVVSGRHKQRADVELWLAIEVSHTVDRGDMERAQRRAAALRRAGFLAVPVVAGRDRTEGIEGRAAQEGVVLVQDGSVRNWDEALRRVES